MKFDFVIIAVLASIANGQPYCADSEVRFNINGDKEKCTWDELACTENFYSDEYASHCKATCNVIECCSDSLAKFKTPSDGYKDCTWVGKKSERCNDTELSNTCPVSCKLCTQPTVSDLMSEIDLLKINNEANINELMSEIDLLKIDNEANINELMSEIDLLKIKNQANVDELMSVIDLLEIENDGLRLRVDCIEVSQTQFCVYADNDNLLSFPTVHRNGKEMVYVRNSLSETWIYHKETAIACDGYLADVMNEKEFEKVTSLQPELGWNGWIGGYQDKLTCNPVAAADCWTWTNGSLITYLNWDSGEPNNLSARDCLGVYNYRMHDANCVSKFPGVYVLPTDFISNPDCEIVF